MGRYRLGAQLGAGGMGTVYEGHDRSLDRKVAIKVVNQSSFDSSNLKLRFKREIKSVAALSHPNVITLHDFAEDNGVVFAVMEFVDGKTLRSRIAEKNLWSNVANIVSGL